MLSSVDVPFVNLLLLSNHPDENDIKISQIGESRAKVGRFVFEYKDYLIS